MPEPERLVALVTSEELPDLDPDSQLLPPALAEAGLEIRIAAWSDPSVEWERFDTVIVRSTWDDFDRPAEFAGWIDHVEQRAKVVNPARVMRWNAHKSYLRDLEQRGVRTVETLWLDAGDTARVPFEEAVVKPAVDGGAKGLRRARRGDTITAEADLMVQPLVASIATEGELSLLYAAGELSHTVRKVPKRGDIRSQPEYGSVTTLEQATDEARDAAQQVLDALGDPVPYARVDLVRDAAGELCLIELEVIEPQLYLAWDPEAPRRFASALAAAA